MHEDFELERGQLAQASDRLAIELPRQHHPVDPEPFPGRELARTHHGRLGGHVHRQARSHRTHEPEDAQLLHDHRVHAGFGGSGDHAL